MQGMDLWTQRGEERLGQIEKIALMYIHSLTLKVTQVSDSLRHHGLQPARLLYPWDFPSKNTEVGCHSLLQEMFPTQGSNPVLLHWLADSLMSEPLNIGMHISF